MSNYVLGIVAHVDRLADVERMSDTLHPDLIEVDDGTLGCGGNHLATIVAAQRLATRLGADWVVILEDDAKPVDGFHHQLTMALDVAPTPLVSLYLGKGYPAQKQGDIAAAVALDPCWIQHSYLRHAVAYALHRDLFQLGLLPMMASKVREKWAPDDAITAWARRWSTPVSYANPSLVDHLDGPSVIGQRTHLGRPTFGRKRSRHAHNVGQRDSWDRSMVTV